MFSAILQRLPRLAQMSKSESFYVVQHGYYAGGDGEWQDILSGYTYEDEALEEAKAYVSLQTDPMKQVGEGRWESEHKNCCYAWVDVSKEGFNRRKYRDAVLEKSKTAL